jgi:glucose PTS system EIICB or EIICBA component
VRAFGGRSNIASLDACITRLRITVNDMKKVNKERLKALGASGVLEVGNSAQAIFGPRSENLKTDMAEYLKTAGSEADEVVLPTPVEAAATDAGSKDPVPVEHDPDAPAKVRALVAALGGIGNIKRVDSVALTRLRIEVIDSDAVDEQALQAAGAQGVLRLPGGKLHLIVGLGADQYEAEMRGQLAGV